jgi:hypothetical protein
MCIEAETKRRASDVKIRLDEARIAEMARIADTQRSAIQSAKAIELLSRADTEGLAPEALLKIIDLFNAEPAAATTYLAMESADVLRRAWLQRELTKLNDLFVSSSD